MIVMVIDWQASKEAWIADAEAQLVPRLLADPRFVDAAKLIARFRDACQRWRRVADMRSLLNDGNELAAAAALLDDLPGDRVLRYEPRLAVTPKSIDFKVEAPDGSLGWIDVKTVAPVWKDDKAAWDRAEQFRRSSPPTAQLVVDRAFCGAAIAGQAFNARLSFARRALQLEEKAALLTQQERGPVRLLLCSAGEWNEDDLEDFGDFYRTGRFRGDDWSRTVVAQFMTEKGIAFAGTISGFCYLERRHDEVAARRFTVDVRGPAFGA